MKIGIASDHNGYRLKEVIKEHLYSKDIDFVDCGWISKDPVDYPDFAISLAIGITRGKFDLGILSCGTGIGMSIAANKVKGIRAALCHDVYSAKRSREHNDANVLCLGGRVIGKGLAIEIVDAWLESRFEGERHKRRLDKIKRFEEKYIKSGEEIEI